MTLAGARNWLALACLALAACTSTPPQRDMESAPTPVEEKDAPPAPSEIPPDLANTPDAVPQNEPLSATGNPDSYDALGQHYSVLKDSRGYSQRGYASWYGKKFQGKKTSSGERYDMFKMTAAHRTLPIPCYARITNLANGKTVTVRINDRGPFKSKRIVDLSYAAALKLGIIGVGEEMVQLDVVTPDSPSPPAVAVAPAPTAPTPTLISNPAATASVASTADPPAPVAATPSLPLPPAGSRFLQAGVFSDAVNAASQRAQLIALGVNNIELRSDKRGDQFVYRVLIGPFTDLGLLQQTRQQLTAQQVSCWPVSE
jgi:rare lipoprotein A